MADRCVGCHTDVAAQLSDPVSLHGVLLPSNPGFTCRSCHPDHRGADVRLTVVKNFAFPHETVGFSLAAHQRLDEAALVCGDCHLTGYRPFEQAVCKDCHAQLEAVFATIHTLWFGNGCLACHDGIDTYGSDFDHGRTAFPLEGRHAAADCSGCHPGARSVPDLQSAPQDCHACHAEDDAHQSRYGSDCGMCHSPAAWEPSTFDHALTAFPLEGKHAELQCESCHLEAVFAGTPIDCYACHADDDPHRGTFGADCRACHTTGGWLPATFDHRSFPLTAGHAGLPCIRCHTTPGVYVGLSTACAYCHADPPFHAGLFGANCAQCHNTSNWRAAYNGPHPRSCDGQCISHEGAGCRDCHTRNLATATCLKCHDSNNPDGDGGGDGGDDD
jgi:hypothetical protein